MKGIYEKDKYQCPNCAAGSLETSGHLLVCPAYADLREWLDPELRLEESGAEEDSTGAAPEAQEIDSNYVERDVLRDPKWSVSHRPDDRVLTRDGRGRIKGRIIGHCRV